ncbi:MAG: hypothetical protein L6Q57_04420 [Alphaproteobacteria bacterium]|nr:hypothetical protein [Alphaproteobacteria bacterium]
MPHKKAILWAVILSETSHIFCCVLPTLFSVLSLLAGLGMVSLMPPVFVEMHEMLHAYEVPIIAASGLVLLLGWVLHRHAQKVDCHDTGCHHGPCGTQKGLSHRILLIATLLFVVNVSVYLIFHRGMGVVPHLPH